MKTNFTLEGVQIKRPSNLKIEYYNITKATRLANGDMSMDLIAQKRKFYLTWESITSSNLNSIMDIIWTSRKVFFTFTYVEDNVVNSAVVYTGAIPKDLHRTSDGDWVWKNVEIHLIER